jgi:hypothetical protein
MKRTAVRSLPPAASVSASAARLDGVYAEADGNS